MIDHVYETDNQILSEPNKPLVINMKGRIKCVCGAVRSVEVTQCPICYDLNVEKRLKPLKVKYKKQNLTYLMKKHATTM
jgi:hypothetical protein